MSRHLICVPLVGLVTYCITLSGCIWLFEEHKPRVKPASQVRVEPEPQGGPLTGIVESSDRGTKDIARVIAKFEDSKEAILDKIESLGVRNATDLENNSNAMVLAKELVELLDHLNQTRKCYERLKSLGFQAHSGGRRLEHSSVMGKVEAWEGAAALSAMELDRIMEDHNINNNIIMFDDEVGEALEAELEKREERRQKELEGRRKEELAKQRQEEQDRFWGKELEGRRKEELQERAVLNIPGVCDPAMGYYESPSYVEVVVGNKYKPQPSPPKSLLGLSPSNQALYWAKRCRHWQSVYEALARSQAGYRSRGQVAPYINRREQKKTWDNWVYSYNKYCESLGRHTLECGR